MIRHAWALLLTRPGAFSCRDRWTAIQLTDGHTNLIYVYRTASRVAHFLVKPRQLDPERIYAVKKVFPDCEKICSANGARLMTDGFGVVHPLLDAAAVYLIV